MDHHLRQADEELAAQARVLCGDAGGAIVEVADAQVLAAQCNHGRGAKAEGLGTEDGGLDHVQAGLQAAIGLHPHPASQAIGAQHLLRLGQAQLPGRAGVFHAGQGRGAGAAVIAGDGDQVRIGLGDSGGDGADPGFRHQLHRDQRFRVDLLQVIDELRQIFDGIDVVMRRRRDQGDAGLGAAQAGDMRLHLLAWQLAAFSGFRALGDLDLQHLGVHQVMRGDAETTGRHLLDLGHFHRAVAGWVFAALARIGATTDAIHALGQSFVRLGGKRAQRHAGGVEALQDGFDRLHRIER